jgi:uncharacterized protein YecT (DUF1311 family)
MKSLINTLLIFILLLSKSAFAAPESLYVEYHEIICKSLLGTAAQADIVRQLEINAEFEKFAAEPEHAINFIKAIDTSTCGKSTDSIQINAKDSNILSTPELNIPLIYYGQAVLLLVTGALLAFFGLKRYSLSLSLAFAIPTVIFLSIFNWLTLTAALIVGVISLVIFVFSKPLTYLFSWSIVGLGISILSLILYQDFFQGNPHDSMAIKIIQISYVIGLVTTIFLRKQIKAILIGLLSGQLVGVSLACLISARLINSGNWMDAITLPGILVVSGMILGVIFQLKYALKTEKINQEFNNIDSTTNQVRKTNIKNVLMVTSILLMFVLSFWLFKIYNPLTTPNVSQEINTSEQTPGTLTTSETSPSEIEESKKNSEPINSSDITSSNQSVNNVENISQDQDQKVEEIKPSFECIKANSIQDKLVCSDKDLANMDMELSKLYAKAKASLPDAEELKNAQRIWYKSQRNSCQNLDCLKNTYESRIIELSEQIAGI